MLMLKNFCWLTINFYWWGMHELMDCEGRSLKKEMYDHTKKMREIAFRVVKKTRTLLSLVLKVKVAGFQHVKKVSKK
jgi:hypothetical protein